MRKIAFMLLLLFVGLQTICAQRFELVTSTSQLESGCRYIFVNSNEPGKTAQMMGGSAMNIDALGLHGIAGNSVTIGQDGIIELRSGILGAITRPERCIYTLTKTKDNLFTADKWMATNYQGLALSTARDESTVIELTQLLGQAQLVEVTDETTDIDLGISFRDGQVFINSGEINASKIIEAIKALAAIGDIQDDPTAAIEVVKALDPLRYLTAQDVNIAGWTATSFFSFNIPVSLDFLKDLSIDKLLRITEFIDTNLYLYKEIEEPTTFELVTDMSQIVDGEEYIILNEKQTEHGKNKTPVYALSTESKTVLVKGVEGTDISYSKFEHQGVYGLDGQSFADVRPSVKRLTINGNETDGYYFSYADEVLSALTATNRNIGFTEDNTYARMSINIGDNGVATIYALDKETQKEGLGIFAKERNYNHLGYYNKIYTFFTDKNETYSRKDIYLYRKAKAEKLAKPVITPASNNGVLGIGQNPFYGPQTVTITCEQEGAHIYYTLDGSDPNEQSAVYTEPFVVDGQCTVKAIATYRISKSDVATATYVFKKKAPTLTLTMTDGELVLTADNIEAGDDISYTIQSQGMETVSGTFTADNATTTVTTEPYAGQEFYAEAVNTAEGYTDSDKATASYTYTDIKHVTSSINFEGLARGAYNNGVSQELADAAERVHDTKATPSTTGLIKSYPQVSSNELALQNGQSFVIKSAAVPYTTVTAEVAGPLKINGETINPINGLVTWHNGTSATEIVIEPAKRNNLDAIPTRNIKSIKLTMPKSYEVTISERGYVSYCPIEYDVEVPADLNVLYVDRFGTDYAHLSETVNAVKAGEGVFLRGNAGVYQLWASENPVDAIEGNHLHGTMKDTPFEENEIFIFNDDDNVLKFFRNDACTLAAGKVYLNASDVTNDQSLRELHMAFGKDVTGIQSTVANTVEGRQYNIQGQRVADNYKGIVIINGKKHVKK